MKIPALLALGMVLMTLMPLAGAQEVSEVPMAHYSMLPDRAPLLAPLARGYPTFVHEWIADLEKAGIVNRALPNPYRVALPVMSFGERGPTLMFTYARNLPGSAGSSGPLLFIHYTFPP